MGSTPSPRTLGFIFGGGGHPLDTGILNPGYHLPHPPDSRGLCLGYNRTHYATAATPLVVRQEDFLMFLNATSGQKNDESSYTFQKNRGGGSIFIQPDRGYPLTNQMGGVPSSITGGSHRVQPGHHIQPNGCTPIQPDRGVPHPS